MADLFISIFAYLIVLCSVCIYVRRRKYKLKYKMIGVMFRLAVLFVVFHLFNALIGFSVFYAYMIILALIVSPLLGGEIFGVVVYALLKVSYEFVFWFPESPKIKSTILSEHSHSCVGVVGQTGLTKTKLAPIGKVDIEGEEYHAKAATGYIDQGEAIKVVGVTDFEIIVQLLPGEGLLKKSSV